MTHNAVRVGKRKTPREIGPCERSAVRRDGQTPAANVTADNPLADERHVLPPRERGVGTTGAPHVRAVAMVGKVVERLAVG